MCCRDVFPISFEEHEYVQEVVHVNGFEMTEEPSEPEVQNNGNRNLLDCGVIEASRNSSDAESEKQNKKNEHFTKDFMDAIDGPWNMEKINSRAELDLNGTTDVAKVCPDYCF